LGNCRLRRQQQRRNQYADHVHSYCGFDQSGKRGGDYRVSSGQQRGSEWEHFVLTHLQRGHLSDADSANDGERESVRIVDRMHGLEHGDLHDHGECEYDGYRELRGGGDYVDHGDADDPGHDWDVAAVCGNGCRDGKLHERRDVDSGSADGKHPERGNNHDGRPLSNSVSGSGDGDRDGDQHL